MNVGEHLVNHKIVCSFLRSQLFLYKQYVIYLYVSCIYLVRFLCRFFGVKVQMHFHIIHLRTYISCLLNLF